MSKSLNWTPRLISKFWDGLATTGVLEEMSFARLAGPALLEFMQPWLPCHGSCLDFGGGSGHLVRLMCNAGIQTSSFEASPRRAKATEDRLSGQSSFSGTVPGWSRSQFDFVVCAEVIEHILPDGTDGFLKSLIRRIAPGGVVLLTTPFNENLVADHVYCPNCDHEFHRWQHMRSWEVSDIETLMRSRGLVTEWIGVVGFDDLHAIRDFSLRRIAGDDWPWWLTDRQGHRWPRIGLGDHITYIGRKPAEPKMSLDDPQRLIAAGLKAAHALGATPIAVVPSSMADCVAPVVIVDDQTIERARGQPAEPTTTKESAIVFPGPISLLAEVVDAGRLPRTQRALVFESGSWRQTTPVPPPRPSRESRRRVGLFERMAWRALSGRRENLKARLCQPYVDKRKDDVLNTLLAPGDFPFRMTHIIDRRVLIAIGGLYSGGAERQIVNTVEGLSDKGIDVHMLVEYLERGTANAFYLDKAEHVAVSVGSVTQEDFSEHPWLKSSPAFVSVLGAGIVSRVLSTARAIKLIAPEVVQTSLDWTNITVGLAAILAGVPHVFISGRNLGPQHFEFFQWFMYPCYQAMAEHSSVHFLNNSEAGRDDYANWLGLSHDKIKVLRNGLHAEEFSTVDDNDRAAAREKLDLKQSTPVVVGAFRLSAEKRPLLWVETAAEIARTLPEVTFLLCGVGNMWADVEAHVRHLGLDGRVRMLGSRSDIQTIFTAADVVLQTSLQEGTPNTLIEAQAMGIPVVTTPAFGAAEAVEHGVTGYVVAHEAATALAAASLSALRDPKFREKCRETGPSFIDRRFGFVRMIDETIAGYANAGLGWAVDYLPETMKFITYVALEDFVEDGGLGWRVHIASLAAFADDVTSNNSPVLLLEDGQRVGPPHSPHSDIREHGAGRYSHWGEWLYLSTPDQSDPRANGRRYAVAISRAGGAGSP